MLARASRFTRPNRDPDGELPLVPHAGAVPLSVLQVWAGRPLDDGPRPGVGVWREPAHHVAESEPRFIHRVASTARPPTPLSFFDPRMLRARRSRARPSPRAPRSRRTSKLARCSGVASRDSESDVATSRNRRIPDTAFEATALHQAASRLEACRTEPDPFARSMRLDEALGYNLRLWTLFECELSRVGCDVFPELRTRILELAEAVERRTLETWLHPDPEKLQTLIDINLLVAQGLEVDPDEGAAS